MKKVAFYTLGCKVNQYETEVMEEKFEKKGYKVVNPEEKADIYVINTCTVTNLGDRKSRQFIRRAKKNNKNAVIAVVGCYAQVSPKEVSNIKEVDVIMGTKNKNNIVDLCEKAMFEKVRINAVDNISDLREFEEMSIENNKFKTRAYIKIQEGCNRYCSYCIIPYARGPIRSRSLDNIILEAEKLAHNGYKEIVLTGIHIASYGLDLGTIRLIDVIEKINLISGIERIRLGSLEPTLVDKNFLDRLVKLDKVCDHFHLSLQSGSNSVLKRMNRKYTTEQYSEIVDLIRKYMPESGITTDIIVGFPGETDEEFEDTYRFIKKIGFSKIHVFKYSPRKGTPAAMFKNQIGGNIKNARSKSLIDLGHNLTVSFNKKYVGRLLDVLLEKKVEYEGSIYMEGYTSNYIRVLTRASNKLKGNIVPVKITSLKDENLIGEIEDFKNNCRI